MLAWVLVAVLALALLLVGAWFLLYRGSFAEYRATHTRTEDEHREIVEAAREHSRRTSRAVNTGLEAEQLAPWIEGFPYAPKDARFFGKPADFVVFDGLSEGSLREIVFVEIKTGRPDLNTNERQVRKAIEEGRVRYEIVRLTRQPGAAKPELQTVRRVKPISALNVRKLADREAPEPASDE